MDVRAADSTPNKRSSVRFRAILAMAIVLATPAVCGAEQAPWPTPDWPTAAPADHGLDPAPLDDLVERIRSGEIANIHSLLLVRNGWLVLESYFNGHYVAELHEQQSVTKSFTSAAIGIAIEQGRISGVEEPVLGFFDDDTVVENLDERKRRITLEDLLTMRSGTDYNERGSDSPHWQLNRMQRGWTKFILDRPMLREPGTHFQYDSGAVILSSALIKQRYGVHADIFARKHLFEPLGIDRLSWYRNAERHPHTGGGLALRSRDMARFGLLYLRDGRWGDRQVVPKEWVRTSLSRQVEFDPQSGRRSVGYGYWWWVFPPDPGGAGQRDIYAAAGWKGQYIFIVPEHEMVVVVTAGCRDWTEEQAIVDFLYESILPSVR
jgi:CubicO group peptidase (beta-lactamase class C family)